MLLTNYYNPSEFCSGGPFHTNWRWEEDEHGAGRSGGLVWWRRLLQSSCPPEGAVRAAPAPESPPAWRCRGGRGPLPECQSPHPLPLGQGTIWAVLGRAVQAPAAAAGARAHWRDHARHLRFLATRIGKEEDKTNRYPS
jgi:hypothetical protein